MGQGINEGAGVPNSMLSQYRSELPSIAQAYMRSFHRGGPIDVPTYQELYGSYRDVAENEAARQSAALTEAYGSQGARYGSDIAGAQGNLRRNLTRDLNMQSGNLLQSLRQQQAGEAGALANMQMALNEAGMNRLFSDFLRRTSPPPLLGAAAGYNPPQRTSAVF